jgi:hypothetical protein
MKKDIEIEGDNFPKFIFIEPEYQKISNSSPNNNTSFMEISAFKIYDTIRKSKIWNNSGLLITFDESGGFYDHVKPPPVYCDNPDCLINIDSVKSFGGRVPTVFCSPLIKQGLKSDIYDHVSILKYLCDKYKLPYLNDRIKYAPNFLDENEFIFTKENIRQIPRYVYRNRPQKLEIALEDKIVGFIGKSSTKCIINLNYFYRKYLIDNFC